MCKFKQENAPVTLSFKAACAKLKFLLITSQKGKSYMYFYADQMSDFKQKIYLRLF